MKLIIVGLGGVGARLADLINERHAELRSRYQADMRVVGVSDSRSWAADPKGLDLQRVVQMKKKHGVVSVDRPPEEMTSCIRETDADAIVELTPTNHKSGQPGIAHFRAAMESGKHVVTANKGPLATAYDQMTRLANKNGVRLLFSATVGGGNPVLQFGEICASAETVTAAEAIVNRTSTYILSGMEARGVGFDSMLKETQAAGLAEPDPSLDVDGIDTACKIVIISNHVLRRGARFEDVHPVESIREVTTKQLNDAIRRGKKIRMVGEAGNNLAVKVKEIPVDDPVIPYGTSDMTRYHCKYSGPKLVGSTTGGPSFTAMGLLRDLLEINHAIAK
jgi:homoserine dehydrogenase